VGDRPTDGGGMRRLVRVRETRRAAHRGAPDARDAAVALRLNAALFSFWTLCSALTEARGWIDAALALPHHAAPELDAAEAKVLIVAGIVTAGCAEHAQAYAFFERGLAQYRALGDDRGIAWSIRSCAFIHMMRDEFAEAGRRYNESLQLCRSRGDDWGQAWSLYALAFLKLAEGNLAQARRALEEALVQLRRQDMPFGVFRALLALGYTLFEQGDVVDAEARFCEGLALSREWPLLTLITIGLDGLAMVAAARGRPLRAARLWGATEALREATGEQRWHVFQHSYDSTLAAAHAQVPEADWAAAWAAGRALTAVQAVAEALEDAETAVSSAGRSLLVDRGPI
jgi:tetratricopeptide (TPR) repeat protein